MLHLYKFLWPEYNYFSSKLISTCALISSCHVIIIINYECFWLWNKWYNNYASRMIILIWSWKINRLSLPHTQFPWHDLNNQAIFLGKPWFDIHPVQTISQSQWFLSLLWPLCDLRICAHERIQWRRQHHNPLWSERRWWLCTCVYQNVKKETSISKIVAIVSCGRNQNHMVKRHFETELCIKFKM